MNAVAMTTPARPPIDPEAVALSCATRACWKAHLAGHHATAAQHAAYTLLRGKSLDRAFSPLRRPSKIRGSGGVADRARREAERAARALSVRAFAPFASLLEDVPVKAGCYRDRAHPLLSRVSP